jgi:two-component system nitrogen regulation sensor histidine kinase GlnL
MNKMLGPNTPPKKVPVNIHEILERVRQLVMVESSENILFIQNYDPSIPEIKADANMLIQVFLNIVRNAVQALDGQGEITLKTRIKRQMTIGQNYHKLVQRIDIIDNGPGIEADMINQIFYPMITGRADGTGLGLSIAHSFINQHNGLIECNSSPESTIFSIYLPVENGHE